MNIVSATRQWAAEMGIPYELKEPEPPMQDHAAEDHRNGNSHLVMDCPEIRTVSANGTVTFTRACGDTYAITRRRRQEADDFYAGMG